MRITLTSSDVQAFRDAYKAERGITLSEKCARTSLEQLIQLIGIIYDLDRTGLMWEDAKERNESNGTRAFNARPSSRISGTGRVLPLRKEEQ